MGMFALGVIVGGVIVHFAHTIYQHNKSTIAKVEDIAKQ